MGKRSKAARPAGLGRREFLTKSCLWASAGLIAAPLRGLAHPAPFRPQQGLPSSRALPTYQNDRLIPHYREASPLDAVLRQVDPGSDAFTTEKYAAEIEAILSKWSAGLLEPRPSIIAIQDSLSLAFTATAPMTVNQPVVPPSAKDYVLSGVFAGPSIKTLARSDPSLKIWKGSFDGVALLGREPFVNAWLALLVELQQPVTVEFKVVGISVEAGNPGVIHTRVRFDVVSTGRSFHRQERVGHWDIDWEMDVQGLHRVIRWHGVDETGSLATHPIFVDITSNALRTTASYGAQLIPGIDHWRTVLDGASRIDVYGNNGIAVGDIDGDGFDDVYVCQPAGLPNRLYRNRGDGTFEDVTERAGVAVLDNTPCALFADLSNSGRQDLIVVVVDGPLLFLNEGGGRFRFKPDAFRFAQPPQGTFTGAAIADYDGDGLLDVYFCLYSYYLGLNQYQYPSPYYDAQNGPPNFLMRNQGDGTFADVTELSGMNVNNNRYTFTSAWVDFDGDGRPDLYVVNDFGRKNLYRNNGNGTFTDVAREAGVEDVGAGMSLCWFDYDNDGNQDLYVADMWSGPGKRVSTQPVFLKDAPTEARALLQKHASGNSLFHNEGNGRFADKSADAGVQMGRWSWSSDAWDFDHDGYPDIYIANGMISGPDRRELSSFFWRQVVAETPLKSVSSPRYEKGWNGINELIRADGTWSGYERNNFYANNRDGTFSEIAGTAGLDFIEDSRAFALADLDHDGRLEVFLKNRSGPQLRILRNEMRELGPSIAFRLRGHESNRDAIGAAVAVESGGLRQVKFIQAGSGFLSQHTKDLYFGLGKAPGPVRATICWPSGLVQHFDNLPLGSLIRIEEGAAQFHVEPFGSGSAGVSPAREEREAAKMAALPAVPLPATGETWLLAPIAAPDFSLADVAGRERRLGEFRGSPLLLSFWRTPSPSSQQDLGLFERRHASWAARGLHLLTINLNISGEAGEVRKLVREKQYSFPILFATEDTAAIYNILYRYLFDRRRDLGIPTSFLVDAQGLIVKVYQGPVNAAGIEADFRQIPGTAAERAQKGLPSPGRLYGSEFLRNQFTYATVFLERGYLDQALANCRLALEREPENAEACYLLGMVYLKMQMTKEARESFEQTLHTRPSHPDTWFNAWNNLGMLAAQEGRSEEAVSDLKEAIRLNPGYTVALENLGNVYRQQHRWAEAESALEQALRTDPNDAGVNYSLGMTFAQQDDTRHAEQYFDTALRLRPEYPEALNNLGILYLRTNRIDSGVKAFETCIRVAPDFDQAYINLAKVYALEGQVDQAAATLHKLLHQHPDHALAKKLLAELGR